MAGSISNRWVRVAWTVSTGEMRYRRVVTEPERAPNCAWGCGSHNEHRVVMDMGDQC